MPFDWSTLRDSQLKWELRAAEKQLLELGNHPSIEALTTARSLLIGLIEKTRVFSTTLLRVGCEEDALRHMSAVQHLCDVNEGLIEAVQMLHARQTVGYTPSLN